MSFPRYPAYKDSGVEWLGEVPEHWDLKPIKALATCNDEVLDESTPAGYEIEYVEISGVDATAGITETTAVSFGNAPSRARRRVQSGDVIVSTVRTYLRAIASLSEPPENMIVSTGFAVIRPQSVNSAFLGYLFGAEFLIARVIARSVGVSYPAINASVLMSLDVPIPPVAEQSTIAAFLDRETAKIDALVAEYRTLIELLKEKRQAVISHAVTKGLDPTVPMKDSGVEWLGEVPEHWAVTSIKHVVTRIDQGWSPQCEAYPVESDQEWGVLKVGCVNGGIFNSEENKKLPDSLAPCPGLVLSRGELLISRANTRDLVGSAALVDRDYPKLMVCDKLYRLQLDTEQCAPEFLVCYLSSQKARGQIELEASGASSSMLNIAQSTILDLKMPLPPRSEQDEIAGRVDRETAKLDALISEAEQAISLLQERRTALISAAVTGKIDVRGLVGRDEAA